MNNYKIQKNELYNIVILVILACGLILRANQYAYNRSLWTDEAKLALNIVNRSFFGLTQPLTNSQGAPIGFLFIQKFFISVFGNTDYILRAFPFMASLISLILIYYVANAYTKGIGKIVFISLFSINSWLIYYASECKQYSSDVMVTLLLLLCFNKCIGSDTRQKNVFILTLVGCISMWLSHPALFIISGICLGVIIDIFEKNNRGNRKWLVLMLVIWSVNFVVLYSISFSRLASNSVLVSYWNEYFMPLPPWKDLNWFRMIFTRMLAKPVGLSNPYISSTLILIGCATYAIRNWRTAITIITPLLFAILASGFKKYPFGERLLLFAVPFIFLYIAEGTEQLRCFIGKKYPAGAICVCLFITTLMAFSPARQAINNFKYPENKEDLKSVMQYVAHHKEGSDFIYVYYGAIPAFKYYFSKYNLQSIEIVDGIESRDNPYNYVTDLEKLKGKNKVWFVFAHNYNWGNIDEEEYFLNILNKKGAKLDEIKSVNASAYLFKI
jgi:hypothetical protein